MTPRDGWTVVAINVWTGLALLAVLALAGCASPACKPDVVTPEYRVTYHSCVPVSCESCGPAIRSRNPYPPSSQ